MDASPMSPKRGHKLKMQKHSDDDRGRVRPFTVPEFQAFAKETGLNTIAVQQMTRYRRLRWPFYHQFTVITTVKILPSALEARMFSLPTLEGRNVLLEDLDPAVNGISFRIDRGRRSEWGEGIFEPSTHQKCDDTLEIIRPGAKLLGGPGASEFEITWCLTRKPGLNPTSFSLRVGDVGLFLEWMTSISKDYDLFRNNCWILCTSLSHLTLVYYFHYEFDLADRKVLRASHGPVRRNVSRFFSGPKVSSYWLALERRRFLDDAHQQRSFEIPPNVPFLSHPERAGFGLLLRTCATSSMGGFANQPDEVLFNICVILAQSIIHWSAQIREDPNLRDNFRHFIDELSGIGLQRPLMTLRPDIRLAYTCTMTYIYRSSLSPDGVLTNSGLYTESIRKHFIPCISQYMKYFEVGDFSDNAYFRAILHIAVPLVSFRDELEELIRVDVDILSVLVGVFRRERHLTPETWRDFELLLFQFCGQNPVSRKYFLQSDALLHVRDVLMRNPNNQFLLGALYHHTVSESVATFHDRLISCGILIPLAKYFALTDSHDGKIYVVIGILLSAIDHNKGEHLLEGPILSYLAESLNHPFSPSSLHQCGKIFLSLCSLGDHAKRKIIESGALPGLCRLGHRDSYDGVNYDEEERMRFVNALADMVRLGPSYAAVIASAQRQYGRKSKVQTFHVPRRTIWERTRAIVRG